MRQTRAPWLKLSSACGISPPCCHHLLHRDIRAFVEELGGGEGEHAVVLAM
jgi:hypothetical protein